MGGSATTNTLTGDDGGDVFDVTGANSGDVNGPAAFTFSFFENLVGGAGDDSFVFTGSAQLTGGIDGGAGSNTLSYAGYGQAVSVQLTGSDADGFTGVQAASLGGTFQHIRTLIGSSGVDQLTGENVDSTWNLNAASSYTDAANTLNFSSFEKIQGGSGNDTFNVVPQQTQPWTIDGGPPVLPTLPGDVLNLNLTGATGTQQTVTEPSDGTFTFTNRATVTYTSVETINATGRAVRPGFGHGGPGLPGRQRRPRRGQRVHRHDQPPQDLLVTVADNGGTCRRCSSTAPPPASARSR